MTPDTRLIVITNLHNPSGALADETELRAIGELARRKSARGSWSTKSISTPRCRRGEARCISGPSSSSPTA